jgi:hypothetical protein
MHPPTHYFSKSLTVLTMGVRMNFSGGGALIINVKMYGKKPQIPSSKPKQLGGGGEQAPLCPLGIPIFLTTNNCC